MRQLSRDLLPGATKRRENQELETGGLAVHGSAAALNLMNIYRTMRILRKPIAILVIFLGFKAIQTVYSYATGEAPTYLLHIHVAELIIFTIVSFYAIKGRNFAIWTMGIYLLAQVFTFLWAVFIVPTDITIRSTMRAIIT